MLRVKDHAGTFILRGPIKVVDNGGLMGPCLRAEFKLEGYEGWNGAGDFRLDTMTLIEPVPGQIALEDAA